MDRRDRNHQWYSRFDEKTMSIFVNGPRGHEIRVPAKYEVCSTCDGKGSHVNPSIDAHGLTAEDFAEDPDFREDYFAGKYDMPCNECHGRRVVPAVDYTYCPPGLRRFVDKYIREFYELDACYEAERRLGA